MSSHYANFVKEREGFEVIENEKGYFEYKINGDECYIRTMYVAPEFRGKGEAKFLAEQVLLEAKKHNCKYLTGSVTPSLNPDHATESMAIQIKYGFKLHSSHQDFIILRKEI